MPTIGQSTEPFEELIQEWNVPVLEDEEVHVWFADLFIDAARLAAYKGCLSLDEQRISESFLSEELQNRYVVSHAVLRLLLSGYSGMLPEAIMFDENELDKPYWTNGDLHFNLSHSGDHCAVAISSKHEVGVDIEEVRYLHDFPSMIQRNFTPREQDFIKEDAIGFEDRFFQLWTIKESYLKATGVGMRLDPALLDFAIDEDQILLNSIEGKPTDPSWKFEALNLENGCKGTLACHPNQTVQHFSIH